MKKLLITVAAIASLSAQTAHAESERYCNGIGELARGYAEDRATGQSYKVALSSVSFTLADAKLPPAESEKWRRDMNISIRWVHKDFPKLSPEGAYKLIHFACLQNDLK